MLSTISRKSNNRSAQRRPRIGQRGVRLAQPFLLQRLQRAVLLELAGLAVDELEQRRVALADDGAVVSLGAEPGQDLELPRPLLDKHLERVPPPHPRPPPLGDHILL